jgi:hypothetical protein
MPRFAIVEHDHPTTHWDLFLEDGPTLRSWRLLARPVADRVIPAEPTAAHRPAYLDYEGPVSGGRGSVTRFDAGEFVWVADEPGRVIVRLEGRTLAGLAELWGDDTGWTFRLSCGDKPPGLSQSSG